MTAPEVIVDFRFDQGLLFVQVANLGGRPALDVSVEFSPGFGGLGGTRVISDLALFRRLAFLAPGRHIEAFVDTTAAYFGRDEPERIQTSVAYSDPEGHRRQSVIRHDLSVYRSLPYAVRKAPQ